MSMPFACDPATEERLRALSFDVPTFEKLRSKLRAGEATDAHNRLGGRVEPPYAGDIRRLPAEGSAEHRAFVERGLSAVREGQVATVILAGGMATRFGGVVKAAVPAVDDHTFLDLKLRDAKRLAERAKGRVPVFLMTSFATEEEVAKLAAKASTSDVPVSTFVQSISARLTPEGEVFLEDGAPSLYAPGHGDLTSALRRAGVLQRFVAGGGRVLFMSNVDNVAASLDPAVIGAHLAWGQAITAEASPNQGDKGGAPARVDGHLEIVEAFRFPTDFDQSKLPAINNNTFTMDATQLDRDFPLTWFAVKKTVEGRPAIQFERLVGQLTAFLPTAILEVEREGAASRFLPVKDPPELEQRRETMRRVCEARGIL